MDKTKIGSLFWEDKKMKKIPVECYCRIVGYYRPVNAWNNGKREEFKDRVNFKV